MSTTYTQLVADIQSWTENDDAEFIAAIPTFVANAELRIKRDVKSDFFRKYATASTSASDPFLAVPADMILDRWMKVTVSGAYKDLKAKDASYLLTYSPSGTGEPKYYANWNQGTFRLAPTPDAAYTITLAYTFRPSPLSASNESNYISTDMSDALLYATLVQAYGFMKAVDGEDGGDIAFWQGQYNVTMDAIKEEEEVRKRREDARYGEVR